MQGTRVWRGRVKPGHDAEHEQFVTWLQTDEAKLQYAKYLLTGYSLAQQGDDLTVTLSAEEPPPIIRFLRNQRMWPEYWEYLSAGGAGADVPDEAVRVCWRRGE